MADSNALLVAGVTIAILSCVLVAAVTLDLGPFGDQATAELAPLPAAAPCEPGSTAPIVAEPDRADARLIAPRADGHLQLGFNDGSYLAGLTTPPQNATLQTAVGSSIWRSVAQWQVMEPAPGSYDFATTDGFYCAAIAAGIAPLLTIVASPTWAADPAFRPCDDARRCTSPPLPEHYDELRDFSAAVTARYPLAIAIEAWNEPNLHLFWDPPDPARDVEVMRAIHDGVKAVDPVMPVLLGGLSDLAADDPVTGDISLRRFLDQALEAGAGELSDAINIHLYPAYPPPGGSAVDGRALSATREVLAAHGLAGTRIWVTELGVAVDDSVDRDQQAVALIDYYAYLEREPDIDAALIHTLVEQSAQIVGGPGFGWVRRPDTAGDFLPFPVYCRFARLLAEPLRCDSPAPS